MRGDGMSDSSIQSVLKALQVLELFAEEPGWSITEISKELGYPTSTTHRLVMTLEEAGYIHRDHESKKYYLTIKTYLIGSRTKIVSLLKKQAQAPIIHLSQRLNESVNVSIVQGLFSLTVLKADSDRQFSAVPHVGDKGHLHATSVGKCLLAFNSNGCFDQFVSSQEPLHACTKNTITDKTIVLQSLEAIRKQGYAIDQEEVEEGLTCIGGPVFDHMGNCIAAMSVSVPTFRLGDKERIVAMVKATTEEISMKFRF